jgi:hypothetical protein
MSLNAPRESMQLREACPQDVNVMVVMKIAGMTHDDALPF